MPAKRRSQTGNKSEETNKMAAEPAVTKDGSLIGRSLQFVVIPSLLMIATPSSVMLIWFLCRHCDGSYATLGHYLTRNNSDVITGVLNVWRHSDLITPFSLTVVFGFAVWNVLTMVLIPGKVFYGPLTPKGNNPVYRDNGFYSYLVTMATIIATSCYYDVTIVYDRFDEIIATLCLFSLLFCLVLYLKGRISPSSTDSGSSGYFIFDYYWGMELYPRILGIDVKTFTNCRFGLTAWASLVLIFAMKSFKLYGFVDSIFVTTFLQIAYLTKFFWWERGYMSTIDIMLDRAGYYICWGCLVFVPGFYTSVSQYLVAHPVRLGNTLTGVILFAGMWSLALNYIADWQKQKVRANNGDCKIWGEQARYIRAQYRLENGDKRTSILLLSGFWGQARHFHYLPELTLSFCWALPSLFENLFPYTYFIYLCVLLGHRSFRDDAKCSKKYGSYWLQYQKEVPYRIIPGIF